MQTLLQVSWSSPALYPLTCSQNNCTADCSHPLCCNRHMFGKEFLFHGKGDSCHCWPFQYWDGIGLGCKSASIRNAVVELAATSRRKFLSLLCAIVTPSKILQSMNCQHCHWPEYTAYSLHISFKWVLSVSKSIFTKLSPIAVSDYTGTHHSQQQQKERCEVCDIVSHKC